MQEDILYNPGWKHIHDKLLTSMKDNVQAYIDIWYREDIRMRIHGISTQFPHGFVHYDDKTLHISNMSIDLAGMELKWHHTLSQGRTKTRRAMLKHRRNPQYDKPTLFST